MPIRLVSPTLDATAFPLTKTQQIQNSTPPMTPGTSSSQDTPTLIVIRVPDPPAANPVALRTWTRYLCQSLAAPLCETNRDQKQPTRVTTPIVYWTTANLRRNLYLARRRRMRDITKTHLTTDENCKRRVLRPHFGN